jgi:Fe-S-cluster containining protein
MDEPCKSCKGHCCKVGFIVPVMPDEILFNDEYLVHRAFEIPAGIPFRNMKSNGDGYTCIALGKSGECTVWEKRPQACRDFEVEGERCKALRKEYGRP